MQLSFNQETPHKCCKKKHIMLYDIWMVATIIPNKINKKTGIGLYRIKRSRKYPRPCRITSYYSIKFDIIKQCIIKHHLNTWIHMVTTCKHHKLKRLELLSLTENFICRTNLLYRDKVFSLFNKYSPWESTLLHIYLDTFFKKLCCNIKIKQTWSSIYRHQ